MGTDTKGRLCLQTFLKRHKLDFKFMYIFHKHCKAVTYHNIGEKLLLPIDLNSFHDHSFIFDIY